MSESVRRDLYLAAGMFILIGALALWTALILWKANIDHASCPCGCSTNAVIKVEKP